jgi:hypothetical protein
MASLELTETVFSEAEFVSFRRVYKGILALFFLLCKSMRFIRIFLGALPQQVLQNVVKIFEKMFRAF